MAGTKKTSGIAVVGWIVAGIIILTLVCTGLGFVDVNGIK